MVRTTPANRSRQRNKNIIPFERAKRVYLVPGDIRLSQYELDLQQAWLNCLQRKIRGFGETTALSKLVDACSASVDADFVLYDVGCFRQRPTKTGTTAGGLVLGYYAITEFETTGNWRWLKPAAVKRKTSLSRCMETHQPLFRHKEARISTYRNHLLGSSSNESLRLLIAHSGGVTYLPATAQSHHTALKAEELVRPACLSPMT